MPIIEFQCTKCYEEYEEFIQGITTVKCPKCNNEDGQYQKISVNAKPIIK